MPRHRVHAKSLRTQSKKTKNGMPSRKMANTPHKKLGSRRSKGLLSTGLDLAETAVSFLPGAISGIRQMFNAKEASFATPASFASIQNNMTQMVQESTVDHPTLGISGTRYHGTQPLCLIRLGNLPPPSAATFFNYGDRGVPPALIGTNQILLNPVALGGPLSIQAYLHDRFVFRSIKFKFTTYVTTNTVGVGALCVEKDSGSITATDFNTARMVTPNVIFPYRIPKAELDYLYDGPDLFYCDALNTGVPANVPTLRQDIQSQLIGYDVSGYAADPANPLMGFLDIEYVIDFFEPVAPAALLGTSSQEVSAFRELRRMIRERHQAKIARPQYSIGLADLRDIVEEDAKLQGVSLKDLDPKPVPPQEPSSVPVYMPCVRCTLHE